MKTALQIRSEVTAALVAKGCIPTTEELCDALAEKLAASESAEAASQAKKAASVRVTAKAAKSAPKASHRDKWESIKDPKEKTAYYRANKAAILAEGGA